jgi:ectoine hydroxylase-related dioxygenase (phytanoyl-CoA dioxygenase family)
MKLPKGVIAAESRGNGLISYVPRHQDNGQILPEADAATILTVWIPISDATVDNGCLQVLPRSYRGELVTHCPQCSPS